MDNKKRLLTLFFSREMGISGSTTLLMDQYRELELQGKKQGFVVTRRGFGQAVLRENTFVGNDVIVQYIYPKRFFETLVMDSVRRIDFTILDVKSDKHGRYMIELTTGKEKERLFLSDQLFDQKAFDDKTFRQIVMDAYEKWREMNFPENPFQPSDMSDSSINLLFDDSRQAPWETNNTTVIHKSSESIQSGYEIQYEYEEVYEEPISSS